MAVFIQGLADEERIRLWAIEPLKRLGTGGAVVRSVDLATWEEWLPAPRARLVDQLDMAVAGVLEGQTALFVDGEAQALLVETQAEPPAAGRAATETFGSELAQNVALIRRRLRDPALIAERVHLPRRAAADAALLYLKGRPDPALLREVREWVECHAGEEAFRRGMAAGLSGKAGLLPDLSSTPWPGKTAALIDAGYVAVLIDRIPHAHLAPVTAAALLYAPGDEDQRQPVIGIRRVLRVLLAMLVLLISGLIVAVLEYHHEMLPTPFMLSLAAVRETLAVPLVWSVLGLELLQDLFWAVPFRLHVNVSTGQIMTAFVLTVGLVTFVGLAGPLAAVGSVMSVTATMGLVSEDLRYLVRAWRWLVLGGAIFFGLFGISAILFLLAAYLTRAESFGVPFIGETGTRFTTPRRTSASAGRREMHAPGAEDR